MVTNDIGTITMYKDKLTITLKPTYTLRGIRLDAEEELYILALFSSFIKEKAQRQIEEV